MPLTPSKGGVYHPTDLKLLKTTNAAGKVYTAGGNVSWVSPLWAPCSVPVIRSAVNLLVNGKYKNPVILELHVMVCSHSDPTNPAHRLGSLLKRLSPEEGHISFVLATWRDVSANENVEETGCELLCLSHVNVIDHNHWYFWWLCRQSLTNSH